MTKKLNFNLNSDGRILFSTRILRLFAYGFLSVILALYLTELGFSKVNIGLLLTLTLVGDTAISLWITTNADRIGRQRMLIAGLVAVLALSSQRFNLLWYVKAEIAMYALALIGSRIYLGYTSYLTAEQWATLVGSSESAATLIAGTRRNVTTTLLWALWLVVPLGYFSMLVQQIFINPMSIVNPPGQRTGHAARPEDASVEMKVIRRSCRATHAGMGS